MDFADLYRIAEGLISAREEAGKASVIVPVVELKKQLTEGVDWIEHINFHPIECKENDPYGHYECHGTQESRYDDTNSWIVLITYDSRLNWCNRRFVWCKELMHIFDTVEGSISSADKYRGFGREVEMKPMEPSEMYLSENTAKWMALLTLCPRSQRDAIKVKAEREDLSNYDVALRFRIPEVIIPSLFSEYYESAFNTLNLN